MVSVHELAAVPAGTPEPDLELVQDQAEVAVVRCPMCKGLRSAHLKHIHRHGKVCKDCRSGRVIHRTQFHNYWTSRFTQDEIDELARSIWG